MSSNPALQSANIGNDDHKSTSRSISQNALSCLLWHRLKHTNLTSQMHIALRRLRGVRETIASATCHRDTEIIQSHRLSYRQIIQSCIAPPLWGVRRDSHLLSRHRNSNRQIYQASKPKPTPPYQVLRQLLSTNSPALRKQSISLRHSKVQKYKDDSSHRQWC